LGEVAWKNYRPCVGSVRRELSKKTKKTRKTIVLDIFNLKVYITCDFH